MFVDVYIEGATNIARDELEDELENAIQGLGEVVGGGSGVKGVNVDLEISDEIAETEIVERIKKVIQDLGIRNDAHLRIDGRLVEL